MDYTSPTVTVDVDGIRYTSTKFPATASLLRLARIVKVLGEPGLRALILAHLQEVGAAVPGLVDGNGEFPLLGAATRIAHGIEADPELPKDMLANVKASKIRPTGTAGPLAQHFDAHFSGEFPHLYRVLGMVIAHNYTGFSLGAGSNPGSHSAAETNEAGAPA